MFGLVVVIVLLIGAYFESLKKDIYNGEKRKKARDENKPYYTDYNGNFRRVDNNHEVLLYMTDWSNGDRVDIDVKTGEYLNRVPNEDRVRKEKWLKECEEKRIKNKNEAIAKGEPYYKATVQVDNGRQYSLFPGESISHRTSDDLPLEKSEREMFSYKAGKLNVSLHKDIFVMRDYNLGLYVGTEKDYDEKDYEFIEDMKRSNWRTINEPFLTGKARFLYIHDNGFFEKMAYDTPEKKEEYARKIGAFL